MANASSENEAVDRLIPLQPMPPVGNGQGQVNRNAGNCRDTHNHRGLHARKFICDTSRHDSIDGSRNMDFFSAICEHTLQLDIEKERFNKLVKAKQKSLLLTEHLAEIRIATELFIKKHETESQALLVLTCNKSNIQRQEIAIVSQLLQLGADVSTADETTQQSALHYAVIKGFRMVAEELLEYEASPLQEDANGKTPISMALENKDDLMCSLLLKHMTRQEIRNLFIRSGKSVPIFCFQHLIQNGRMKETVKVVLDSLIEISDKCCDDGSLVHYSILEADINGLTPAMKELGFDPCHTSSFQEIAQSGDKDLVCHPAMKLLVDRKWERFARCRFFIGALCYLIVMILMTVAVILAEHKYDPAEYGPNAADIIRALCEIVVIVSSIHTLVYAVMEISRQKEKYLLDPYGYFNVISAVLLLIVIPLRFSGSSSQWSVYSFAYLLSVMRTLKYAALIRRFRTYLRIMLKMILTEFWVFVLLFLVIVLAFTGSFSLGVRENFIFPVTAEPYPANTATTTKLETRSFGYIFLTALRSIIENGPALEYVNESGPIYGGYCTFLLVLYLLVVMIMLLNILVAQLADVYEGFRFSAEQEEQINRAWIVSRVELNTFHTVVLKKNLGRVRHFTEKETISDATMLEYGLITPPIKEQHRTQAPNSVAEQLSDLKACVDMLGERLQNQQAILEKLLTKATSGAASSS